MRYVQIVALEAPGGCNYTARHLECPATTLGRDKPTEIMPPLVAAEIALQLAQLGFRGFYAFHWFSEPMMSRAWIEGVMQLLRGPMPNPRFALWTNGSLLTPDTYDFAASFDRIVISNYDGKDWTGLAAKCGETGCHLDVLQNLHLDNRMAPPGSSTAKRRACVRPYTEFIVTREGDVHLCCQAWRPEQRLGNILVDGVDECVHRFQEKRRDALHPERVLEPGHPCLLCPHPAVVRLRWDETIAREAEASP